MLHGKHNVIRREMSKTFMGRVIKIESTIPGWYGIKRMIIPEKGIDLSRLEHQLLKITITTMDETKPERDKILSEKDQVEMLLGFLTTRPRHALLRYQGSGDPLTIKDIRRVANTDVGVRNCGIKCRADIREALDWLEMELAIEAIETEKE